jgi:Regulator of chromosome condensation (RCC1) repeat
MKSTGTFALCILLLGFVAAQPAQAVVGTLTDGEIVTWGNNFHGLADVPSGIFRVIGAGGDHSIGVRSDGTLVAWGDNGLGQLDIPNGTFTAVAAESSAHSLGIRSDGTLAGWGYNLYGQTNVPSGIFTAVEAGLSHSLALRARTEYDGDLLISGKGAASTLNRSVNVAGDVILDYFPIRPINNPTVVAGGKLKITPNTGFNFVNPGTLNATFQSNGIDINNDFYFELRPEFRYLNTGPVTGNGNLHVRQSQLPIGLTPVSVLNGYLFVADAQSSVVLTGTGYQEAGAWYSGRDFADANNGNIRTIVPGGELRMGPGQRLRSSSTTLTEPLDQFGSPSTYFANNYNGGKIELLGSPTLGASEIEFVGSIHNAANTGLITGRDAVLRFTGGVDNRGAIAITRGANNVTGDITNNAGGTITITGDADAIFYDDVVQNGTLNVARVGSTASTAVFLGSFTGSGGSTGGGDIFFEGDLRPGNSPATVTFNNNVSFGSGASALFELAGTTPGSGYDQILVNGALSLNGSLQVSLIDGFYNCADVNALTATIAAGTHQGSFDLTGDGFVNLADRDAWLSEAGGVNIGAGRSYKIGDANLDGVVDGSDFGIWNGSKFTSNTAWCSGNFNGDTAVDGSDFGLWNSNKFTSSDGGSVVPEPSVLGGLLVALCGFAVRTKRSRHAPS